MNVPARDPNANSGRTRSGLYTSGITVVIPHWNRSDLLARLLPDLEEQTKRPDRVIVVDNASPDGSADLAARLGAEVIRRTSNEGFSRAVNVGVQACQTSWVLVLNNDVRLAPDYLERLETAAESGNASFATGRLLQASQPAVVDGAFDVLCRGACAWRAGNGRPDGPEWRQPAKVQFAPLTAALVRRELFESVGFLDERFESYLEDVDFGLRCALAGRSGIYVPSAVAWHEGSATLGSWHPDTVRRISRNQLLLVAKHYPRRWIVRFGWAVLVAQFLWGLLALRHGRSVAWFRGKWEALRQFRKLRPELVTAPDILDNILGRSEKQLKTLQRQTGFDWYWRAYFVLTGGGS